VRVCWRSVLGMQRRPTEHCFQSDCAQDEIVEVDLSALVTVAHYEAFERRVTHQKTWHNASHLRSLHTQRILLWIHAYAVLHSAGTTAGETDNSTRRWVLELCCVALWGSTPSTPAVPNCCCSKGPTTYWSNQPWVLISDIRALWRSVLSARAPECQKLKLVG